MSLGGYLTPPADLSPLADAYWQTYPHVCCSCGPDYCCFATINSPCSPPSLTDEEIIEMYRQATAEET